MVWEQNFPRERATNVVSPANFIEWRDSGVFAEMAALSTGAVTLTGDHAPVRLPAARVNVGFFRLLRVEPFIGEVFSEDDGENVTVLGYDVWRSRFGADPSILGDHRPSQRRRLHHHRCDAAVVPVRARAHRSDARDRRRLLATSHRDRGVARAPGPLPCGGRPQEARRRASTRCRRR